MPEDLRLAGVLETVLYYASDQQDEMERFYENVLATWIGRTSAARRRLARRSSRLDPS